MPAAPSIHDDIADRANNAIGGDLCGKGGFADLGSGHSNAGDYDPLPALVGEIERFSELVECEKQNSAADILDPSKAGCEDRWNDGGFDERFRCMHDHPSAGDLAVRDSSIGGNGCTASAFPQPHIVVKLTNGSGHGYRFVNGRMR